ncbi:MAG: hypothetical protein AAGD47_01470 [Pseudomonadota bacterium]
MKIRNALIAAAMLAAVPISASALSVSLFEGPTSGGAQVFATDQLVINLTPFPSDLNPTAGILNFDFETTNYSGTITAQTINTGTTAELIVTGLVTSLDTRPTGVALTIVASDTGYQLPFENLAVGIEGNSFENNGDSDVAMAAFFAADNNGTGGPDATSVTAAMTSDPSAALIASGSTGSGPVNGSRPFNQLADTQFALNSIIVVDDSPMTQNGSTFFELKTIATIPVPAPLALLLSAVAGLGFVSRKKKD